MMTLVLAAFLSVAVLAEDKPTPIILHDGAWVSVPKFATVSVVPVLAGNELRVRVVVDGVVMEGTRLNIKGSDDSRWEVTNTGGLLRARRTEPKR